jgi:hypothetical protein
VSVSVLERTDRYGVLLRYENIGALLPLHTALKPQPSDLHRTAIIKAERELVALEIIFDHLELSGIARTRLDDALRMIYRALQIERRESI